MKNKTVSFVIPFYNEENRIQLAIDALKNVEIPNGLYLDKIIFVDDGSTDRSLIRLNDEKKEVERILNAEVKILSYRKNRGKGYAIKTGMNYSTSDYTLFFDVDISTPLYELNKFMPFVEKGVDVVVGTRKNGESTVVIHQPRYRELLGRAYTLLSQTILNTWVTDFTCGFKLFSRKAKNGIFNRSMINRWGFDSEILFLAKRLGYKMAEKSVLWSDDSDTRVNLFKAVFTSFFDLLRIRSNYFGGRYHLESIKKYAVKVGVVRN